jgi:predicted ABC-type ATPase
VQSRVNKGGHNVARQKIIDRYYRSMDLLWEAAQHAYRAYFFDNSSDGKDSTLFANFKVVDGKKVWSIIDESQIPQWFMKYYVQKSSN